MARKLNPGAYRQLFVGGRMVQSIIGSFFGRFFLGLIMIATLSMYQMSGYSYTVAGIAIGVTQISCFLIGPRISRLIDRKGQSKVIPWAAAVGVCGAAAEMLIVHLHGPLAAALAVSVLIGFSPQINSASRARWSYVLQRDEKTLGGDLKAAFSIEGILDDLSYMIAPLIAIMLSAKLFPEAGMLFGTICFVLGVIIMLLDRKNEPDVAFMRAHRKAAGKTAASTTGSADAATSNASYQAKQRSVFLVYPVVAVFFTVMILQGLLFGFFDPGTYGMAADLASQEYAGPAFVCGTFTSMIVVFVFGMLDWKASPLKRVLVIGVATGVLYLPAAFATNLPLLYASHAIGALAYGPLNIVLNSTIEATVSPNRVTECLTWLSAGMLLGMAAGPTIGGILIDMFSSQAALIATSASAAMIPVVLLICLPVLKKGLSRV